jgi:hypothetical protein
MGMLNPYWVRLRFTTFAFAAPAKLTLDSTFFFFHPSHRPFAPRFLCVHVDEREREREGRAHPTPPPRQSQKTTRKSPSLSPLLTFLIKSSQSRARREKNFSAVQKSFCLAPDAGRWDESRVTAELLSATESEKKESFEGQETSVKFEAVTQRVVEY